MQGLYPAYYKTAFPLRNNHKNLDLSYKKDLDLWNSLEMKTPIL